MDDIYDRLSRAFKFNKEREIYWEIVEILLGLFTGGLIADWFAEGHPSNWVTWGIFICLLILIPLTRSRLLKAAYFPNTVVQYLKAHEELKNLKKELDRKKNIDVYIDEAIKALNVNTCPLQDSDEFIDAFCDNPLNEGIKTVLRPIIELPQYILDCSKSRFTIAAHLNFYPEKVNVPNKTSIYTIERKAKTLLFRDDLKIGEFFSDNILEDIYSQGVKFNIHTVGLNALNHSHLRHVLIKDDDHILKLIAAPIPAVCEDDRIGVLFIISEGEVCMPDDLENTLLIFGRIVANWISKYEDCINRRRTSKKPE